MAARKTLGFNRKAWARDESNSRSRASAQVRFPAQNATAPRLFRKLQPLHAHQSFLSGAFPQPKQPKRNRLERQARAWPSVS
jgi:hypothetical protein